LIVAAVLFAVAAAAVFTRSLNHDSAWYLYAAAALRRGARLYGDVSDTNPPLIIWLTLPALWIADVFRLSWSAAFNTYVIAGAAVCLLACTRLVARVWAQAAPELHGLFIGAIAFCLMPFIKTDFSEREHFMLILALPYVLLAAAPDSGRPSSRALIPAGCAAGLGFAIKPHFAIGWAALELLVWVRARFSWRALFRVEFIAAVATVALYAAIVVLCVPQYFDVLRDVRSMYGGLDAPLSGLVRLPDIATWVAAATLVAAVRLSAGAQRAATTLFVAATGFMLAGFAQLKGWAYHMYPSRALMLLFFFAFGAGVLQSAPALLGLLRGGLRNISLVVAAGFLVTSIRYLEESRRPQAADLIPPLVQMIKDRPAGPVAMLSMRTHIYPAFPAVVDAGASWSLRFASLWYLPGLYQKELEAPDSERSFRTPAAMSPVERRYFDGVVDDLCASPPAVLIVEPPIPRAPLGRRSLDLIAYYSQDPRFARLFSAYAPINWLGSFVVYGLERSRPAACQ
jgi:hypothetical protein